MEKIIREYKISEYFSHKYIFDNNLDLLKLYTVTDFQSSIQDHIFICNNPTNIQFSMSPTYITSLNFLNAYDLYIYIQQIKSTEFEYISNIFLDTEQKLEISDNLFYRWLHKNDDFTRSIFYSSLENFNRLREYFITHKLDYYTSYITETFDEKKIRFWFGDYQEKDDQPKKIESCSVEPLVDYIKNSHTFYVNKINLEEYIIISEDNENYTFEILYAYTFYIMSKIRGLTDLIRFDKIILSTFKLESLRKLYHEYKNKYNYKLYVLNSNIYRNIKYIPEGTKIIQNKFIDNLSDSAQDLSGYIDVINYIISLEDKISIDYYYNNFGYRGFEIFNYNYRFNIFDYSDQDNDLWYEFFKILNEFSRDTFLFKLAGMDIVEHTEN